MNYLKTILIIALIQTQASFAHAAPASVDYLSKTQDFLSTIYQFPMRQDPKILIGKNCTVEISGTNSYGGIEIAYLDVNIQTINDRKQFKYYSLQGSIQKPEINYKKMSIIVGGATSNCLTYDCDKKEVFHEYLSADYNQVTITDRDQNSLTCNF